MSRKLVLGMSITLDGFVAGPNEEADWLFANRGDDSTEWIVGNQEGSSLIIMGRRSYEAMASYWPTSTLPFANSMNWTPKMIFTRSAMLAKPEMKSSSTTNDAVGQAQPEPQPDPRIIEMWVNPKVGGQDLVGEIDALKAEDGKPIFALGGASFAASLIEHNLVDEFRLIVHPVALGQGLPIFDKLPKPLVLELIESRVFKAGTIAKVFKPKKGK